MLNCSVHRGGARGHGSGKPRRRIRDPPPGFRDLHAANLMRWDGTREAAEFQGLVQAIRNVRGHCRRCYAFGPIGAAAGALLGGFLFGSSGPGIEGPRLGDLDISSSTYGGVIPVGFGIQKIAGTIIWATDIEEEKRTRAEGEGIFGWGGQDVTEYFYCGNFAVAFGEGPAVDVLRVWAGEKLIFDRRDPVADAR